MKKLVISSIVLGLVFMFFLSVSSVFAKNQGSLVITVITASNEGADFDLDNDAFRDQLIQLFSYSSYKQVDQFRTPLAKAERNKFSLTGGYELVLTLQNDEGDRILVEALIRQGGTQYVNTVLSIMKEGVVFLGGPPTEDGALILVLERI